MSGESQLLLNKIIAEWAEKYADRQALVFLEDGEEETMALTYAELHHQARSLARHLADRGLVGKCVLLLYPSGIDYILAFLGCLYAGVKAVPVYPPRNNYHAQRVAMIARDCDARVALTSSDYKEDVFTHLKHAGVEQIDSVLSMCEFDLTASGWSNDELEAGQVAYLQYTSGSTGNPKGVMVRHQDLFNNCLFIKQAVGFQQGECNVSWLPIFHDLGLVQGIISPLLSAGTAVFMPPVAFVEKPVRWLKAIGRYNGVFSSAPNFAYELCVNKVSEDVLDTLDLSSWRIALNGAEPISDHTLRTFADKFATCGFKKESFIGAYGLAEATLLVSAEKPGLPSTVIHLDKEALAQDQVTLCQEGDRSQSFVSAGFIQDDPEVQIVHPKRGTICEQGQVGEIWVSGSSICAGYWKRLEETQKTFGASLPEKPGTSYLRTGDLGFVHDGQLYITGRLKDLLIVRGENHYPHDIEKTAEQVSPTLRKGGWGAAFAVETDGKQRLVLVQEVERTARKKIDIETVVRHIVQAVAEAHGIELDTVVLVKPGQVPKTSSGKVQRKTCKHLFLNEELRTIGRWQRPSGASTISVRPRRSPDNISLEQKTLIQRLRKIVSELTGIPLEDIVPDRSFSSLGLSSVKVVELMTELSDMLGVKIPSVSAFEYPTISRLADYLIGRPRERSREDAAYEPIAIIGLDCRFPSADNPDEFWDLLLSGRHTVTEIPEERKQLTGFQGGQQDPYRWGTFLSGIETFDAALFGISPREAQSMDPQQRLLLETTWHALESANIAPDRLSDSKTGVFFGVSTNDYFRLQLETADKNNAYAGTGNALSIAANRISYCLGLRGPSLTIDTACSSSLVAVHHACRSLGLKESHLALAGGVNLVLKEDYGQIFTEANMLSPTGHCRTFDQLADGYVRGEGSGVVVLKRLSDAVRDGDRVLGVIRGSAVNQDGYSNGLTAPNGLAQQEVLNSALRLSGFSAQSVEYVETHGTGTPLGDPIEVRSLQAVFDAEKSEESLPCWLGAAKTNIGHLESAAGIAGLIKTVLVLEKGVIPPNCHLTEINRHIELENSRLQLPLERVKWSEPSSHPRRAGVSSFGFGGTNAHVVLEAFDETSAVQPSKLKLHPTEKQVHEKTDRPLLLTLSAKSERSLLALAQSYADVLEQTEDIRKAEAVCRTANVARARLAERLAVAGSSGKTLSAELKQIARGKTPFDRHVFRGRAKQQPSVAFLFTGQGSQYVGMGRKLYAEEPEFRQCLDLCDNIVSRYLDVSIREVMFGKMQHLLHDTRYAQPALVALELSLVEQWRHWGIEPDFVVGHSIGEYSAACVAGVLDLETVLKLVVKRGTLMSAAPGNGMMLSVHAGADQVKHVLGAVWNEVDLAAVNAPEQTVISGAAEQIELALKILRAGKIKADKLKVSHAFHSRLMEPILDEFQACIDSVQFNEPQCTIIPACSENADELSSPAYWVNQLRRPVLFTEAMKKLHSLGADIYLEIGPAPVLIGLGQQVVKRGEWLASLRFGHDERLQMRSSLGAFFVSGADVELKHVDDQRSIPLVPVPRYPFDRQKYWLDRSGRGTLRSDQSGDNTPLIGRRVEVAADDMICFQTVLPENAGEFLMDHRLGQRSVMPAAGYVSLAVAAARQSRLVPVGRPVALRAVKFHRALDLTERDVHIQTVMRKSDARNWKIQVMARRTDAGQWDLYASAMLDLTAPFDRGDRKEAVASDLDGTGELQNIDRFYKLWSARGIRYGEAFRNVSTLACHHQNVYAEITLPQGIQKLSTGSIHPVLLDAAFQTLGPVMTEQNDTQGRAPLPAVIETVVIYEDCQEPLFVESRVRDGDGESRGVTADLFCHDAQGRLKAEVKGLHAVWSEVREDVLFPENASLANMFYVPSWADTEIHDDMQSRNRQEKGQGEQDSKAVLCVYPPHAENLKETCKTYFGEDAFQEIMLGQVTRQLTPGTWEIDVTDPQGFTFILSQLREFESVYFFGGLQVPETAFEWSSTLEVSQEQGAIQLFRLLKALAAHGFMRRSLSIKCVTNGVHAVFPDERTQPLGAGVDGLIKSAAKEFPDWTFSQLDIGLNDGHQDANQSLEIVRQIDRTDIGVEGSTFAFRQGKLLKRVLRPVGLTENRQVPFKEQGVYLILGGAGGIGLTLARFLGQKVRARLVLLGRSSLSEEQQKHVRQIEQEGGEVLFVQADAADLSSLRNAIRRAKQRFGQLNGVIHSALVLEDKALVNMNETMFKNVMAPKVAGSLNLYQAVMDEPLDFLLFFSSVQSFFGNAGQANYAAASTFQDAFSEAIHEHPPFPVKTINWGYWGEVGVAADEHYRQRLAKQGVEEILPHEGMEAICRALLTSEHQLVVVKANENVLAAMGVDSAQATDSNPTPEDVDFGSELISSSELATLSDEEVPGAILQTLRSMIARVMHVDVQGELADDEYLADLTLTSLGIDSLMAMELRDRIRNWVGVDVPAQMFIGDARVFEVVQLIREKLLLRSLVDTGDRLSTADGDEEVEELVL